MNKAIIEELSRIQRELKAPKNLWNKFGGYAYRNAEGILEAVKPLLSPGYVVMCNDRVLAIGDRYYVEATACLTNGEDTVSVTASAREDETKKGMDGCQITGSCSSYARKYALNGLFAIDDNKDSDDDSLSPKNPDNAQETKPKAEPKSEPKKPATNATVTRTTKIPDVQKTEVLTPVKQYLLSAMAELRKQRGITAKENNDLFGKQLDVLMKAGLVPNKPLDEYDLEEAGALIDAMYNKFTPDGTELKK